MNGYVQFERTEQKPKTAVYLVTSSIGDVPLGQIYWINGWRRYGFHPFEETQFDASCLKEITNFIEDLMRERE